MEESLKGQIEKLMNMPGKVRGQVFLTDIGYIRDKFGEKGVLKLKEKIKEWDSPISYEGIRATDWFPIGYRVISLLAIKEAFGWQDKDFFELGNTAPKYSFIVRMIMKYFLSPEKTFQECPNYWKKHYTVGELQPYEYNQKKKYYVIRLKDFEIHPLLCVYLTGYFQRIGQYTQGGEVSAEEVKCAFQGYPFHEFVIRWK